MPATKMRRPPLSALVATAVVIVLSGSTPAGAIYIPPDLVHIPAERLITNLERDLSAASKDDLPYRRLALARAHAAAYAKGAAALPIHRPIKEKIDVTVEGGISRRDAYGGLHQLWRKTSLLAALSVRDPMDKRSGCDADAIRDELALSGVIAVRFDVPAKATAPQLDSVTTAEDTIDNDNLRRCMEGRIATLSFPAAEATTRIVVKVTFTTEAGGPRAFYGHGDITVPRHLQAGGAAPMSEAAKAHLEAARQHYYRLVVDVPDGHPVQHVAHLGLAWTLDQLKLRDKAITCYRKTFDQAWAVERELKSLNLGQQPIAGEAAGYLIPLLDPAKDAEEIARLQAAQLKLASLIRPVTPIVVPLGDETALDALVDASAAVPFDLDGSGVRRAWGWPRPGKGGWLVFDGDGRGQVGSGLQLFGSVTFWSFWRDGYQALSALDDDGDGRLVGAELAGLRIWADRDADGISDPGEVHDLARYGIVALDVGAERHATGIAYNPRGVELSDGRTRPSYDWVVRPTSRAR